MLGRLPIMNKTPGLRQGFRARLVGPGFFCRRAAVGSARLIAF